MSLPGASVENRRATDRFPLRTKVLLVVGDDQRIEGRTLDIGKGGMGVVCDWNLPFGTDLVLRLGLPTRTGACQMVVQARVVNVTLAGSVGGFRLGLQFVNADAGTLSAIDQFLQR